MIMIVSFIGLGVMGYFMVGYLVVVGFDVRVWNCSVEKVQQWVKEYFGKVCLIIVEVVQGVEFVMICVGVDKDFVEVFEGEIGIIQNVFKGVIFVDYIMVFVGIVE